MLNKIAGIFAVVLLMLNVAMPADAALEDYRIMAGSEIEFLLDPVFASIQAPLVVGAVVQVNVDGGGNVVSIKVPGIVVALKDFYANIATAGTPIAATVNLWNDAGTLDVGGIDLAKAQGLFTDVPNYSPVSGGATTWQHPNTGPTKLMYNNYGGFLAVQGGFGGPLSLRGDMSFVGVSVDLGVVGKNFTSFSTDYGGLNHAQALPWATGTASVRNGAYSSMYYHWVTISSAYPSPTPQAYYTRNGASTAMGAAAAYNAAGASAVANTTTRVVNAIPNTEAGGISFTTATGIKALGSQTVSVSLVTPSIFDPSVSFGGYSSIHLNLQKIVPEPGTALLLGVGVIGLATVGRRRRN